MDMFITQFETLTTKESETIQEMHTKFTTITNDLHCLGEVINPSKQVWKILGVLLKYCECKVYAITEAQDFKTLTMDELIGNRKTYELKRQQH